MEKSNRQKTFNFIFFPALVLTILLKGSGVLFQKAQIILLGKIDGVSHAPALKMLPVFPQIILVVVLLIVSKYRPFDKIFKGTLLILLGAVSVASGLVVFQEYLPVKPIAESLKSILPAFYGSIVTHWPESLLYMLINLLGFNLFSLLIWGFVNRLTFLSEGVKYYILLALVLVLGALVEIPLNGAFGWSLPWLMISAMALVILALIVFHWVWKRLPDHFLYTEETVIQPKKRFPFLSAAYLLAGCTIVGNFLMTVFKSQTKMVFSDPGSYTKFMGNLATSTGVSTALISVICVVLGTWLVIKKGWRKTALWSSIFALIGGLIFMGISSQTLSWLNLGVIKGLLRATKDALFFPLVQILYLYLPFQVRFRTKMITEMVVLPLMGTTPALMIQGLIMQTMKLSAATVVNILVPVLLVLLVLASRRIGSRFTN